MKTLSPSIEGPIMITVGSVPIDLDQNLSSTEEGESRQAHLQLEGREWL